MRVVIDAMLYLTRNAFCILVPTIYWVFGLMCLVRLLGIAKLLLTLSFYAAMFFAFTYFRSFRQRYLLSFLTTLLAAEIICLLFSATPHIVGPNLAMLAIGNNACALASWHVAMCMVTRRNEGSVTKVRCRKSRAIQDLCVVCLPLLWSLVFGLVAAITDPTALWFADRWETFKNILVIGIGVTVFIGIPWFTARLGR